MCAKIIKSPVYYQGADLENYHLISQKLFGKIPPYYRRTATVLQGLLHLNYIITTLVLSN